MKWLQKDSIEIPAATKWCTEVGKIQDELQQKRPLPVGVAEFHEWAERIIAGAMLPATVESQKFTLANVLMNSCGPAVAFESDLFFINYLRKHAANQVAVAIRDEIFAARKARIIDEDKQNQAQPAPPEAPADVKKMADHPI